MRRPLVFGVLLAVAVIAVLTLRHFEATAHAEVVDVKATPQAKGRVQLPAVQVKHLEGVVPDQAAVMTKVAYHFTNLYFAINSQNWPLADFYLGETQNNIDWAVRVKPVRKDSAGDIELGGIADSLRNTQLAGLKRAIAAGQKDQSLKLYEETMVACYACHKASSKPYLRPQRPTQPEVKIINFDPNATSPQ